MGVDIPAVLVGSKMDLYEDRKVSKEEGRMLAEKYQMKYLEVSSKLNYNIAEAF